MVQFTITTNELLTVKIREEFDNSEMERIALFLEVLYEGNYHRKVIMVVETDLPKEQMKLLSSFCQKLPYENNIDLKYPLLVW